ncbi:hypothetical protein KA017_01780 [Candidatus Woesebacteria bacterium]|nr:hypothetical protein [Candidatus Woesebacteria bacterium]
MKKNDSVFSALSQNLKNLIPYIGILLVVAGIIGLVFIQDPLKSSQDLRGEAVGIDKPIFAGSPFIKPELRVPFVVNKTGEAALYLDSAEFKLVEVNVVFSIINDSLDTPEIIVNPGSGFDAKSIEIEQINGGYLVNVVAVPNNLDWLVQPSDTSLIRMKLVAHQTGNIIVAFDQDRTYGSTQNLEVLIQVPSPLRYSVTGSGTGNNQEKQCTQSGGTWKEFPNNCADRCGDQFACLDVLTMGCDCGTTKCWDGATCAGNPSGTPTPTPTATPPVVQGCNELCANNAQCKVNMLCYPTNGENRCRLATNPTNSACQVTSNDDDTTELSSCNESCVSNSGCQTGLTCWNSSCRNPMNPQSTSCAAPSTQQTTITIQQCGQTCTSNANCAVNLRCYEGECRLATNPSSTSCSAVTKKTVSTTYSNKVENATTSADIANSDTPLNKGDNLIPDEELDLNDQNQDQNTVQNTEDADRLDPNTQVAADETLFGLFKNLIANSESKLPFFIILLGVMLLILSIFAAVLGNLRKPKNTAVYHPTKVDPRKIDVKTYDVKPDLENQQKD